MCLAIPMRIKNIEGEFAQVEISRLRRTVNIQMLPDLKAGDYVIVHAGFAIQKIDSAKAKETLRLIDEPRTSFALNKNSNNKKENRNSQIINKNKDNKGEGAG